MTTPGHPYVGPDSFDEEDSRYFFGRQEEIFRLRSLAIARRAVLLYSPSGAGKSSLLRAGLLPELRSVPGVACLPVARVSGEVPEGLRVSNVFVFHLLSYLLGDAEPAETASLPLAAGLDRAFAALAAVAPPDQAPEEVVLTIDQLEEIFSAEPHRRAERDDFFRQLHDALDAHRGLTLLLALREDWLAHLDPHLGLLPDRLRTRFRLELLSPAQALQAVTGPAAKAGTPFRPEVARRLVDNLRRAQTLTPEGASVEHLGEHVDPVQLQVVCRRLWERRPAGATEIDEEQVRDSGVVDLAQAAYYTERVAAAAAAAGVPERRVRDWCERALITPQGIRGQVLRGPEQTQGLDNRAVGELVDAHLVRAEPRRGAVWYELAHDRLIRPVRDDNAAWLRQNETAVEKHAALWQAEGRPPRLLLLGRPLIAAQKEAESLDPEPPRVVVDFLGASRQRQRVRRKWRFWIGLSGTALAVALFGFLLIFGVSWLLNFTYSTFDLRIHAAALRSASVDESLLLALSAFEADRRTDDNVRSHLPDPRMLLAENLLGSADLETILYGPPAVFLTSVAWSPDGRFLLAGDASGAIRAWDAATGRPKELLLGKGGGPVTALAFSPDGRALAAAGDDGTLVLRDARDGRLLRRLAGAGGPGTRLLALRFTADGGALHAITRDGMLSSWNPSTGRLLSPPSRGPVVTCAAFMPDGRSLAAGLADGSLVLLDAATGARRGGPVRATEGVVQSLAFSPRGDRLAVGTSESGIRFWDPAALQPAGPPLAGLTGDLHSLAFSPDGARLASGHWNRIGVWFPRNGPPLGELSPPPASWRALALPENGGVQVRALSPDGRRLATGDGAGRLTLLDPATGRPLAQPQNIHQGRVTALAFDRESRLLLSAGLDGRLVLREVPAGAPRVTVALEDAVFALAFHPGGDAFVSGDVRGDVLFRDLSGQPRREPWPACRGSVESLAYAPDGEILVAGCSEGTVEISTHGDSPEDDELVGLPGHGGAVHRLVFTADGRLMASAGRDGTIFLWDPSIPRIVAGPLRGHSGPIQALTFDRTGTTLLSIAEDGQTIRWDVDPASWRRLACRRANRNLTDEEWEAYLSSFVTPVKLCPQAPEQPQE